MCAENTCSAHPFPTNIIGDPLNGDACTNNIVLFAHTDSSCDLMCDGSHPTALYGTSTVLTCGMSGGAPSGGVPTCTPCKQQVGCLASATECLTDGDRSVLKCNVLAAGYYQDGNGELEGTMPHPICAHVL